MIYVTTNTVTLPSRHDLRHDRSKKKIVTSFFNTLIGKNIDNNLVF